MISERSHIGSPTGALTGKRYKDSLHDTREVWLNGEKVDVTTHPAFSGMLSELMRLFDLQHSSAYQQQMTTHSHYTGSRVSYSYFLPRNYDELLLKKYNTNIWTEQSWGLLPRIPDFMANVVVGLYDFREQLYHCNPRYKENVERYHHYCQEHDLVLTHAIGDPQIDRSKGPSDDPDMALRVVRETGEGIIVRGAKQLATLAPLSHEVLIYLSPSFAMREMKEYVVWFAIPMATPGLKILCRESHSLHGSGFNHPFASRYDEQDAMLFFDDVLVPWERVFLLYDAALAAKGFHRINAWSLYSNAIRFHQRLITFIGIASMMAEAIGVNTFRPIQEKLGELVSYAEMTRLSIRGMEIDGYQTDSGLFSPANADASGIFAAQISPRLCEIIREIGASGLIMQPSEADLNQPELRLFLERYMRGKDISVDQKSRLFRLAWDLVGDSYGSRQDLYERWNRGDIARNRINLYMNYDKTEIVSRIHNLISNPI